MKPRICILLTFSVLFIIKSCNSSDSKSKNLHIYNLEFQYETKYFLTYLDHFTYKNDSNKFPMKYLISTKNWVDGNPILFYCGNEGSIELFANNSGFVWELGEQLSAIVVFAEHRFYGSTLPFGKKSYDSPQYFGYLNSEQALADYADLLNFLKSNIPGASNSPVIAFGGSYGGMLAAWFRQKYPNIVAGSLAASAPVLMVGNIENCSYPFQVLTRAYQTKGSDACVSNVRNVWPVIQKMNDSLKLVNLSKIFHTCQPLKNVDNLIALLTDGLFDMGMANYPYPANFLAPMPAWPVKEFCKPLSILIKDPIELLTAFYTGLQVFYNYTGQIQCLSTTTNLPGLDDNGWNVQTCTELPMPMCTDGVKDMFYASSFNKQNNDRSCLISFGVTPRWGWGQTLFWGKNLNAASNIIFSNGLLDPWAAGGVFNSPNPSIEIVTMKNGAHHVDLRSSHPKDTYDIRLARKLEKNIIMQWIKDWHQMLHM